MNLKQKFTIQTYNIGIIRKNIGEVITAGNLVKGDITWLTHSYKDRFFADPFLWYQDAAHFYVLVEEYIFWEERGKISLLTISKEDFRLTEKETVINRAHHLSYPFCEENDDVVTPEAVTSRKCIRYYISKESREIYGEETVLPEGLIDQTFLKYGDSLWLFTAKAARPKDDLYIYKADKRGHFRSSTHLPAKIDRETTRSAGRFFYWKGKLIRPVQDCKKRYGHRIKLMEMLRLEEHCINEIEVMTLSSENNPPFNDTMHTFNVYDGFVLIDGSKDYVRFPMKLFYKKLRPLMAQISHITH